MFTRYIWLLLLFAGAYVLFSNKYYVELIEKYITKYLEDFSEVFEDDGNGRNEIINLKGERMWTKEELKKYQTLEDGLYLAILGQVFDVTEGKKHYGPGGTYHAFAGHDASLAFITGDFTEEGLIDDISSLSPQQTKALNNWVEFYIKTYPYKGKLIGNFYHSDGSPAAGFQKLQSKLKQGEESDQKNQMFPPCNIEWKLETGTRVWCTTSSGGIHRDWAGVPRMYFERPTSKQHRCACVNLQSKEFKENEATFREFDKCLEDSSSCALN